MAISSNDRSVLGELARQVAEIAALPVQQETIRLWKALNGLRPVRPMVMIDQLPWHQLDVDGELALGCEDDLCRQWETQLRRTLYKWKHLRADMVVEPVVDVNMILHSTGFGVQVQEQTESIDLQNDVISHHYDDQLQTEEDLEKIHAPEFTLDEAGTARRREQAEDVFGGLLNVRLQGHWPYFAPWDAIVMWRGAQPMIMDLAERPEFMHRTIRKVSDAYLGMLDDLEDKGLLMPGNNTVHCTGNYSDELPPVPLSPQGVKANQLWTFGMSQIFSTVSPAMHQEFELDYAVPWHSRFGLVYYGCCEPLDNKIDIIRRGVPHVRKVSMSPWVDVEKGAERLGRELVFSRKPSPALLAGDSFDAEAVERDLGQTLDACARHHCGVELILKDVSTVRYDPQRLWQWAEIARRLVEA